MKVGTESIELTSFGESQLGSGLFSRLLGMVLVSLAMEGDNASNFNKLK